MRLIRAMFLLAFAMLLAYPANSSAQVAVVSITVAPPVLPVYVQPAIPAPGYFWTPGYWAYGADGYYWVPGTWVLPPRVGLLWTPGYWGWRDGIYAWNAGYWGPQVGYYGGVAYGFGYVGVGYAGGYWHGGVFMYNHAVNNFGAVHITNVYSKTVIVNNTSNISFNGGPNGLHAQPTAAELAAAKQPHVAPTALQVQNAHAASANRALLASVNHGHPAVAATAKPGVFQGRGVVAARGATPANGNALGTGQPKTNAMTHVGPTPHALANTTTGHTAIGTQGQHKAVNSQMKNNANLNAHPTVNRQNIQRAPLHNMPRQQVRRPPAPPGKQKKPHA
jgi:WXXGXW repeat (2 copies)